MRSSFRASAIIPRVRRIMQHRASLRRTWPRRAASPLVLFLFLASVTASCSDAQPVRCATLDEAACKQEEVCQPLRASLTGRAEDDQFVSCRFIGPPEDAVACSSIQQCSFAAEAPDQCFLFRSGCRPDQWLEGTCGEGSCPPALPE